MTSVSSVQPLLGVPSLASAWTAVQSISRHYANTDARLSAPAAPRHPLNSPAVPPTLPLPPEWVADACRSLGLANLPAAYAREELNRLTGNGNILAMATAKQVIVDDIVSALLLGEKSIVERCLPVELGIVRQDSKAEGVLRHCRDNWGLSSPLNRSPLGQQGSLVLEGLFRQQLRGFKTKRAVKSMGLGLGSKRSDGAEGFLGLKLFRNALFDKTAVSSTAGGQHTDRFRSVLSATDHSSQDKMKIAFAEGYAAYDRGTAAASASSGASPVSTWSRRIVRFFWYGLAVWVAVQLYQTYKALGGNMKINVLQGEKFEVNPEDIAVTFDDVKGVDEAKQELSDIVDYLRNPDKFKALGAKLPKGVLLVGPPGIGKSLLARAVAGEAGVPFFHASGSEFDEVFVGTGAKRVRQLFDAAKSRAPCIVFIDEIDTVGAKRTSSQIHPYANQTINQLLSEMDGFQQNEGVIVLGATNRRDNLDKALLRPGRFDVEVRVFPPDLKGRRDILDHYLTKVKMDDSVDVDRIARGTTGCTGADLENMVNQAALKAAMDGDHAVTMIHMEYARDKVLMGPAKKTRIPDDETNLITAYHEAGHTLVAYYTRDSTPLNKVTIIPRGMSLGHTSFMPDKEEYNLTRSQLLARMDVAMGGRVAEELIYGNDKVTTGASSDFQSATAIATAMVKRWGMSDRVGVRVFSEVDYDTGVSTLNLNEVGPATTDVVDQEIRRLLQESYERARAILKSHQAEHRSLAAALIKHETLSYDDIKALIEGRVTTL